MHVIEFGDTPQCLAFEEVRRCIAREEQPGIHTHHLCDCGRGGCRNVQCAACWREVLSQFEPPPEVPCPPSPSPT